MAYLHLRNLAPRPIWVTFKGRIRHSHNYQRYTRTMTFDGTSRQVPVVVCGNGGHNVNPLVKGSRDQPAHEPENGVAVDHLNTDKPFAPERVVLEKYDDRGYGYLRVAVDDRKLRIAYHQVGPSLRQSRFDLVTVSVADHVILPNV